MYIYQHGCGLLASEWPLKNYALTFLGFAESKEDAIEILENSYRFFGDWVQDFLDDHWIW